MRRLITLIVLAAVAIGGVGFYRGWFTLVTGVADDGKQTIGVKVDKDKIKADEEKGKEKFKKAEDKVKDKTVEVVR